MKIEIVAGRRRTKIVEFQRRVLENELDSGADDEIAIDHHCEREGCHHKTGSFPALQGRRSLISLPE